MSSQRVELLLARCELPIGLLALAVVPALILEDRAVDPTIRAAAFAFNWFVWMVFCVEYGVKLAVAPPRLRFVREAWFDLAIIVLSPPFIVPPQLDSLRTLRAVRLLRLARLLRAGGVLLIGLRVTRRVLHAHHFHDVLIVAASVVGLGAVGIYAVEHHANPNVASLGDALWWAVVTATTVGYGDISPVTLEGRILAVVLMLVGIAVISLFTATVASFFFEQEKTDEHEQLRARLDAIEAKLDALLRQPRGRLQGHGGPR